VPAVTPHTLRHSHISILLLVTANVPYVMEQVGHEDEATTTRIYRHLIRQRQEHGAAFDRVVAQARESFGAPAEPAGVFGLNLAGAHKSGNAPDGRTADPQNRYVFAGPPKRARQDSNLRPLAPEASALSTELRAPVAVIVPAGVRGRARGRRPGARRTKVRCPGG
jgi:hypothetical protein